MTVNKASPKNNKRVKIVFMTGKPEAPYSKDGAKVDIRVVYYTGEDPDGYEYIRYINDPTIYIPLVEGKDYKITYKNNKTVSKGLNNPAVAAVTLIGNYTGSTSYEFYIYAAESMYLSLSASDKAYTGKAGDFKSSPVVYHFAVPPHNAQPQKAALADFARRTRTSQPEYGIIPPWAHQMQSTSPWRRR